MPSLSVRIDARTAALVKRVARERGLSKSEVVRMALATFRKQYEQSSGVPPSVALAHLIGSYDSGGMNLSERTGERFAQMLLEDRKRRRQSNRRAD
jgi:Ribbon-helix-helix protein, copG family